MDKQIDGGYGDIGGKGMKKTIIIKRTADWLEKMSVASMAVGVFQGSFFGFILGVACYFGSLYLSSKGI